MRPAVGEAAVDGRHRALGHVLAAVERHDEDAVGHLGRHLVHLRAQRAHEDRRDAVRVGAGVERGRRERVAGVLALEPQRRALLPVLQDRLDRQHPLAHVRDRPPELAAEALLHVRLDLRAEAEPEAPAGQLLEVVGRVGQVPRAARERDGDVGHEVEVAHRRRRDQREEEVVRVLEAEDAVDAERLQLGRPTRRLHHRLRELDVDLHGHARRP